MDATNGTKKKRKPKNSASGEAVEVIFETSTLAASSSAVGEYSEHIATQDETIQLWIELEGCDAVPVKVNDDLQVHDLKLMLGGFSSSSQAEALKYHSGQFNQKAQLQQMELLGLRGVRPQQIKLKVDGKPLHPASRLCEIVRHNSTIQLQVVPSPITASVSTVQGSSSSSHHPSVEGDTLRLLLDMRHELDSLRRRAYTPYTTMMSPHAPQDASQVTDLAATSATPRLVDGSEDGIPLANRLEVLEAKIDTKNAQLDALMKEIKALSLALRGMNPAPAAPGAAPAQGPSNVVDGLPNIKCKQTIEAHGGPIWTLAKTDSYIISGSSDTTVQVWDIQSMRPVRTLNGHTSIVHSVEVWNNTIISGSEDRCLKFWDMDQDFKCVKTIKANNIACVLRAASNHLFAGLYKTVKVWNLETGEFSCDLDNHNHWVRALNVTKGHLYSGCYNVVNMIDLGTLKHMKSMSMSQNVGSIYSIVVDNNILYAGTYANCVAVFDLRTFECVRTLTGHTGAVYSLALSKGTGKLYSGSYDTTIRVWDVNTLSPIQRMVGHTSTVEALLTTDSGLYSASSDGTMRLWK